MMKFKRMSGCAIRRRGAWLAIAAALLGAGSGRAANMKVEDFFSDSQLAAYVFAQKGQTDSLLLAVRSGLDLAQPGRQRMTLLGLAVLNADRSAIVNLIKAGANPNQIIPEAGSPAVLAITRHFNPPRTEAVAALIEAGFDVNQLISSQPYLFYFVDYNHWPGLALALRSGGNINACSSGGESLLTYVVEGGDYEQARALIMAGADVSLRGQRGETALRALEGTMRIADPTLTKSWRRMVELRQLILSHLSDPATRRSFFTDEVERKLREYP